jgi:hypothetical protein
MKKFGLFCMTLGLLALPSIASAINLVGGANPTWTFDTAPAPADWGTGSIAGDGNTVNNAATFDTAVAATTAASYTSAVGSSATNPPTSTNALFRHNTTGLWLQSAPTGNAFNGLVATLHNGTANYFSDLAVSFNLTETTAEAGTDGPMPGYRIYYSTTGAANSWTSLGSFSTTGPVNLNINGLGTNFGDNLYLLWADDNANGGTEGQYHIDDVAFTTTLGGPKAPPTPVFGTLTPNQSQTFETPGTGLPANNGAQGTTVALAGSQALQANGSGVNFTTDQVDLRGVAGQTKTVGVDLKAWETSATSDFEAADRVAVIAEWSSDGLTFQNATLLDVVGAPALTPFDPNVPNPADQIRATFGPTEAVNNATEAFKHFSVTLPSNAATVRVHVILQNDSTSEFMAVDNITVSAAPVPEPASVAMIGLGMIGLVGYGIRRRRSA